MLCGGSRTRTCDLKPMRLASCQLLHSAIMTRRCPVFRVADRTVANSSEFHAAPSLSYPAHNSISGRLNRPLPGQIKQRVAGSGVWYTTAQSKSCNRLSCSRTRSRSRIAIMRWKILSLRHLNRRPTTQCSICQCSLFAGEGGLEPPTNGANGISSLFALPLSYSPFWVITASQRPSPGIVRKN